MTGVQFLHVNHRRSLTQAVEIILDGGVIVYPTDTLYGLGADATNTAAIGRLNKLKGRQGPVSVIARDTETVAEWTTLSSNDFEFVQPYLRGKTTVILPVKPGIVAPAILAPDGTLGIRIPDHRFPRIVAEKTGRPLTTTSVNRSGQPPLNDPGLIREQFGQAVDLIVDDGILPPSGGSTIYRWENDHIQLMKSR